jgi:hypothetical protein
VASKSAQPDSAVDTEEVLDYIDKTMERLKSLYEQYFLGMQKQPPSHLHNDVERRIRDLMQIQIRNTGLRYRFATLQQKFGSYSSYWRRTLRQIEQGTYLRQLSRISRKAAQTGEEIPEEILAAMPKRMRDQVKRDREQALALAARRAAAAGEHVAEETVDQGDDAPAMIGEPVAVRNAVRRNQHTLDESEGDMDFEAFFASMSDKSDDTNPDAKPFPSAAGDEDDATSFSDGPPAFVPPPRAAAPQAPPRPPPPPPRASGPIPTVPPQRASGPIPPVPPARASGPIPSVPPQRPSQPPPPPAQRAATAPPVAPPAQAPKFVSPQRVGTQQGVPPAPTARPATAPSQVTRPNPIQPGASQQRPQVPVESMQGPFPRQPTPQPQPAPPARPTPRPEPAPPMRPPPGMNDADVNALYAKYVNAKKAVGADPGPGAYGKLLKTINAQAPKIMEQYNAKGVEFSIVVKDNQVIIKAKPKP